MKPGYYFCNDNGALYIVYPDTHVEYFFGTEWRVSRWSGAAGIPVDYFTFIGPL